MSLAILLLGIIILSSLGLTGYYFFLGKMGLSMAYLGAAILYLGLIINEF